MRMEFITNRASTWDGKPCDEAKRKTVIAVDERTVNDPKRLKCMSDPKKWYTDPKYFNHRVENGHIKRDFKTEEWVVEINTLEELLKFIDKYGQVIVGSWYRNKNLPSIEIYDDYRE